MAKRKASNIRAAVRLLRAHGYTVTDPPKETAYAKALRTGVTPEIWPPIVMTRDELEHFRQSCGIV